METYKIFSKEPVNTIENIILHEAIPKALSKVADILEKEHHTIPNQNITQNIPILIYEGMNLLRNSGEEGKKIYELTYGCILASFLNRLVPVNRHEVCYPENESYDFVIMSLPKDKQADFNTPNKPIYKKGDVFKVELAEPKSKHEIKRVILNKISNKHDYKERMLLIALDFAEEIDFDKLSGEISQIKQDNFTEIWLMRRAKISGDNKGLYYFFIELIKPIKDKKPFIFKLPINWSRIEQEVNQAITN